MSAAAATELQCHFTWNLDGDTTKRHSLDELADKLAERLPHSDSTARANFLNILAFLHTLRVEHRRVDLPQVKKRLQECLELSNNGFDDPAEGRAFEFLARANWLLSPLQQPAGQQNEREELRKMWEDPAVRAHVLAAKGATLRYFGPGRYGEGVAAYGEALRLLAELRLSREGELKPRFQWLWGRAYLMARLSRIHNRNKPIPQEQLQLWAEALRLANELKVTDPRFFVNYAEAILHCKKLKPLCVQLTWRGHELLLQLPQEERHSRRRTAEYEILLKLFKALGYKQEFDRLLAEAEQGECANDSQLYLTLAKMCNVSEKEQAVELLEKGQSLAGKHGHVWVDLELIVGRADPAAPDDALLEFDSLAKHYEFESFTSSAAAIRAKKSLFLLNCGRVQEASDEAVAASRISSGAVGNLSGREQRQLLSALHRNGLMAHVAWFVTNFGDVCRLGVECRQLLQEAVAKDPEDAFAREQLGRCLLEAQEFAAAAEQFEQLPSDCQLRKSLWAEALLRNPAASLRDLDTCLRLGCKDACPRVLSELQAAKVTPAEARSQLLSGRRGELQLIGREAHELCARLLSVAEATDAAAMEQQLLQLLGIGDSSQQLEIGDLRRLRLQTIRLHQESSGSHDEQRSSIELLKEAKVVCDRTFASRLPAGCGGHVAGSKHAFVQLQKQLLRHEQHSRAIQAADAINKKEAEAQELMKMLRAEPPDINRVRQCLQLELKASMPKSSSKKQAHQCMSDEEVEFLASREHRILVEEDAWLVRWLHFVNANKHSPSARSYEELLKQLQEDSSQRRGVYELCHLVAEFAEETRALLLLDSSA